MASPAIKGNALAIIGCEWRRACVHQWLHARPQTSRHQNRRGQESKPWETTSFSSVASLAHNSVQPTDRASERTRQMHQHVHGIKRRNSLSARQCHTQQARSGQAASSKRANCSSFIGRPSTEALRERANYFIFSKTPSTNRPRQRGGNVVGGNPAARHSSCYLQAHSESVIAPLTGRQHRDRHPPTRGSLSLLRLFFWTKNSSLEKHSQVTQNSSGAFDFWEGEKSAAKLHTADCCLCGRGSKGQGCPTLVDPKGCSGSQAVVC